LSLVSLVLKWSGVWDEDASTLPVTCYLLPTSYLLYLGKLYLRPTNVAFCPDLTKFLLPGHFIIAAYCLPVSR